MCPDNPWGPNRACVSLSRAESPMPEKMPSAAGSGRPSCLSRTATWAVSVPPADVP